MLLHSTAATQDSVNSAAARVRLNSADWCIAGLAIESVDAPCGDGAPQQCVVDTARVAAALGSTLVTVQVLSASPLNDGAASAADAAHASMLQGATLTAWLQPGEPHSEAQQQRVPLAKLMAAARPAVTRLDVCPVGDGNALRVTARIVDVSALDDATRALAVAPLAGGGAEHRQAGGALPLRGMVVTGVVAHNEDLHARGLAADVNVVLGHA